MSLPPATVHLVKDTGTVKVDTLISAPEMFTNTSHIIELPSQLILVDGQFFAPDAAELKDYVDRLGKPVTRFYISHEHPDHYIGFGDAFPDVAVYALPEIRAIIEKDGQTTLDARRETFGPLIASKLNVPTQDVVPGTKVIDGVTFVFEKASDNEAPVSLVIKLPELGVAIVQDIVYHDVHLFITGPTANWRRALEAIRAETGYDIILPGHGMPGSKELIDKAVAYLDTVDDLLSEAKTAAELQGRHPESIPRFRRGGAHRHLFAVSFRSELGECVICSVRARAETTVQKSATRAGSSRFRLV